MFSSGVCYPSYPFLWFWNFSFDKSFLFLFISLPAWVLFMFRLCLLACASVWVRLEMKKYKLENEKINGKLDFNVRLIPNFSNLRIQSFINNGWVCVSVSVARQDSRSLKERKSWLWKEEIDIYLFPFGLTRGVRVCLLACVRVSSILTFLN